MINNEQNASIKILIIEDDPTERISLQAALETSLENAYIEVVETGLEAENLVKVQAFDILLVDYRLPDIDGLTLMKKLRQSYPELATIVVTGYSSVEVAVESMGMGAYDYMVKPIKIEKLIESIYALLSDKEALHNGKAKLNLMVNENFKYLYDNPDAITVVATPDTNVLLDDKVSFGSKIKNIFRAIKKYYWG